MEDPHGQPVHVTKEQFVATIETCLQLCASIECIFLNLCESTPFADAIHEAFPQLTVRLRAARTVRGPTEMREPRRTD